MRSVLIIFAIIASCLMLCVEAAGQKKPECEQGTVQPRNWELIENDYVYFDYVLCPADMKPVKPLVRIWITTAGEGIAVEKWTSDRDGADLISFFLAKDKKYTLYRDLKAVPNSVFKAERRSQVPNDMAAQPFMVQGTLLVPLESLTSDSAVNVNKAFSNSDSLVKRAEKKVNLLFESPRIAGLLKALASAPKPQ